jgi:DNA-3-methyladenine glycosylase
MNLPDLHSSVSGAKALLGYELIYESPAGVVSGMIVETEAYGPDDPAAHSFKGKTMRNAAIFGPAGMIYIYLIYGMHYCFNLAAGKESEGQAILIRALQPIQGIELMRRRRGDVSDINLANGPAKLVEALGIPFSLNASMINTGPIQLRPYETPKQITTRPRVGITKAAEWPWRYYITGNRFVSRP